MFIYVDLDYNLHNYSPALIEWFSKRLKDFDIDVEDFNNRSEYVPFGYLVQKYPFVTNQMIDDAIEYIEKTDVKWSPTPWSNKMVEKLLELRERGHKVIILTARNSRDSAQKIIKQIFGDIKIPIVTARSSEKHFVVRDYSVVIDDNAKIINSIADKKKHCYVLYPKWSWNANNIIREVHHSSDFDYHTILRGIGKDDWENIGIILETAVSYIEGLTENFPILSAKEMA